MLIQETTTDLPRAEVIARAREWFTTRFSPYAGFIEDPITWVLLALGVSLAAPAVRDSA